MSVIELPTRGRISVRKRAAFGATNVDCRSLAALQRPVPLPPVLARLESRPFVGRAAPLRRVHSLWEEARARPWWRRGVGRRAGNRQDAPGCAGRRAAHADGAVVLYGRADEESVSPYQPFVEALRHYAAHRPRLVEETRLPTATAEEVASLVPELRAPSSARPRRHGRPHERSRHELFDAVVRLLLHAAEVAAAAARPRGPALGGRPDAARCFASSCAAVPARPLLVIVTYSDLDTDAAGPLIAGARRAPARGRHGDDPPRAACGRARGRLARRGTPRPRIDRRRVDPAAVRADRRQSVLHRGAAAHAARGARRRRSPCRKASRT